MYVIQTTLAVRRSAWKARSLATEDGRTTTGYVVYSHYDRDSQTLLVCDLLARGRLLACEMPGATADQVCWKVCEATQAKLDADHRVLKKLIGRRCT